VAAYPSGFLISCFFLKRAGGRVLFPWYFLLDFFSSFHLHYSQSLWMRPTTGACFFPPRVVRIRGGLFARVGLDRPPPPSFLQSPDRVFGAERLFKPVICCSPAVDILIPLSFAPVPRRNEAAIWFFEIGSSTDTCPRRVSVPL